MLDWFRALMPKDDRFFVLFDRHAEIVARGAKALRSLLDGGVSVPAGCQSVVELEQQADSITREVVLAVRRTFVTPFDRSDIQDLIGALDDSIDQMQKTARAIVLFEVETFAPGMQQIAALIDEAAQIVHESLPLLRSMGPNAARLNAMTERVIQLEDRADDVHNQGLKALFLTSKADSQAMAFVVGSEVYDHLEKVMDRLEDVANHISSILVDHL